MMNNGQQPNNISNKPKVLLAGVILLVLMVIFYSFFVRKLTPVIEGAYFDSSINQLEEMK